MISLVSFEAAEGQTIPDGRSAVNLATSNTVRGPFAEGMSLPESRSKGFSIDRHAFVAQDGSADVRHGIVGTMPIAPNASVGIGLYRVSRYSRNEPNFKKLLPMEDVDGRHQRIAAVGVSLRF